jgi:hypothetical protein
LQDDGGQLGGVGEQRRSATSNIGQLFVPQQIGDVAATLRQHQPPKYMPWTRTIGFITIRE